jgi:hypothetical protein
MIIIECNECLSASMLGYLFSLNSKETLRDKFSIKLFTKQSCFPIAYSTHLVWYNQGAFLPRNKESCSFGQHPPSQGKSDIYQPAGSLTSCTNGAEWFIRKEGKEFEIFIMGKDK